MMQLLRLLWQAKEAKQNDNPKAHRDVIEAKAKANSETIAVAQASSGATAVGGIHKAGSRTSPGKAVLAGGMAIRAD